MAAIFLKNIILSQGSESYMSSMPLAPVCTFPFLKNKHWVEGKNVKYTVESSKTDKFINMMFNELNREIKPMKEWFDEIMVGHNSESMDTCNTIGNIHAFVHLLFQQTDTTDTKPIQLQPLHPLKDYQDEFDQHCIQIIKENDTDLVDMYSEDHHTSIRSMRNNASQIIKEYFDENVNQIMSKLVQEYEKAEKGLLENEILIKKNEKITQYNEKIEEHNNKIKRKNDSREEYKKIIRTWYTDKYHKKLDFISCKTRI